MRRLPLTQAAARRCRRPHSRFPVVDGSPDEVLGFVHLRDLLIRPTPETAATVRELTRPLRALPASKGVLAALAEMRRAGDHLALVVDEYGGTAGIVTLEDLDRGARRGDPRRVRRRPRTTAAAPPRSTACSTSTDFADRPGSSCRPGRTTRSAGT